MVSLRERKSRASYTNVAEGLEDLSSGDERRASGAHPSGSGSGRASGSESDNDMKDDEGDDAEVDDGDTSLSSGGSSEFRPDSVSPGKGKGKGKTQPLFDPDSSSEDGNGDEDGDVDMEEVDDDEDDIDPVLRSISMTTTPAPELNIAGPSSRNQPHPSGQATDRRKERKPHLATLTSTSQSTPVGLVSAATTHPANGQSEIYLLDLAYREAIRQSTISMTYQPPANAGGKTDKERHNERGKDQTKVHGIESFPAGHPVPFSTRLLRTPGPSQSGTSSLTEIEWIDESRGGVTAKKDRRKKEGWATHLALTTGEPWEFWRGEGWWPEMYLGMGEGGDGNNVSISGKREDWLMKEDVRLGLGNVGSYKVEDMVLLTEEEAELYLPTPINQNGDPWTTCYLGPHDQQVASNFEMFTSKALAETNPNAPRVGYTFFAGGPIWGLDWCPYPTAKSADFGNAQYLAVSTLPHIETRPAMYEKWPRSSHGSIQIWSLTPSENVQGDDAMNASESGPTGASAGGMRCEMVLCVQGGPVMEIKWMPLGAWDDYDLSTLGQQGTPVPKLGIIAAVQLDGSMSFYPVPHPRFVRPEAQDTPIYLRLDEPLLRLEVPDASCMCFDWLTGTRIAVGLSNGHLAVWDILDALESGNSDDLLPSVYTTIAVSAIRSLAVGRTPPSDSQLDSDPIYVVMGSYDGSTYILDLRDPLYPVKLNHSRVPCLTVGWSQQMASPLTVDSDFVVLAIKIRKSGQGRGHPLLSHRGQAWDLATSDYHTMLLSGGADGAVILTNLHTGFYRRRKAPLVQERLYEVDYNATTGEFRIIDDILPEAISLEVATSRRPASSARRGDNEPPSHLLKTAAWSPNVGIHKVAWNNGGGLGQAGWVVSGGASGLGRVEWVEGRWKGGRPEDD
ncbi:hypothetical protein CI109_103971 [Kwoniella shandongensis]|uniref:Uncharacterized protein n=1 Tax=Kwoniella shandongensis TaxID=1734106 RepID=A0A5M6BXM5_9TREE|nr:uncharacterized protein CI109_004145 [Kwoniella shandongensis]KAA5527606.1 hypothetical protein CI109_004145 [Kwoniella shandongensis]